MASALVLAVSGAVVAVVADNAFASSSPPPANTVAMPGAVSGYTQTLGEDFSESSLDTATWATYGGATTSFSPSHVVVSNGELVLQGYDDNGSYKTAGVTASHGFGQTYGNFAVRFRMDSGPGYTFGIGLYPLSGSSPPAITIGQGTAGGLTLKADYTTPGVTTTYESTSVDSTQWNTLGVNWTAGSLVYTLNGTPWATETGSAVPSTPMSIALQTGVNPSLITSATPSEVDMDVAWVTAYAVAASSSSTSGGGSSSPPPPPVNTAPMPTGNLPGWDQTIADNFSTDTSVNRSMWVPYTTAPNGDPSDTFTAADVDLENHELELHINHALAGWNSGGLSETPAYAQTYGKYEIRFRMDPAAGLTYVGLLWPMTGSGPPEVDFMEGNGAATSFATYGTTHYRNSAGLPATNPQELYVDTSTWHTLGVEWSPRLLTYTLDGQPWGTVKGSEVPTVPMELCIQTQEWEASDGNAWENSTNASTPLNDVMHVAWVTQYSYDASTASS